MVVNGAATISSDLRDSVAAIPTGLIRQIGYSALTRQ
ncbi:hypothetical protein P3T24_004144 [Paraburkholderia sp. GAS33]|jgi:hypothetical protein